MPLKIGSCWSRILFGILLTVIPAIILASSWSAQVSCYKQGGMQGESTYQVSGSEIEGETWLYNGNWSGSGGIWWARYPYSGPMEWGQETGSLKDYVNSSFSPSSSDTYFWAECTCYLLDSDGSVYADH